MTTEQIKQLWDEKAQKEPDRATTNDVYLRELEARVLIREIKKHFPVPRFILDAGCGDGKTTLKIAHAFQETFVVGWDYSEAMIALAKDNLRNTRLNNCAFSVTDLAKTTDISKFEVVVTSRVLINIPTEEEQFVALANLLRKCDVFIGIENFVDEQINFEIERDRAGLHRILIHNHNVYLEESSLRKWVHEHDKILHVQNFANAYYYATRIVYAAMCKHRNETPDYLHDMHRIGIDLPEIQSPNIAPMKLIVIR